MKGFQTQGRAFKWAIGMGTCTFVALGLVLLFLLTQATAHYQVYEQNYPLLLVLNVAVAVFLALLIAWLTWGLVRRFRQGQFGSRLLVKLAWVFVAVGVVPGLLIYGVSYQFVSRSIENWFDTRVEAALTAGLHLGQATLETLGTDLSHKAQLAAAQLAASPSFTRKPSGQALGSEHTLQTLQTLRAQLGVAEIAVWNEQGQQVASSALLVQNSPGPSAAQLAHVQRQGLLLAIEGLDEQAAQLGPSASRRTSSLSTPPASPLALPLPVRLKAWVPFQPPPVAVVGLRGGAFATPAPASPLFLQLTQNLPAKLVSNALAVQEAYREYQERALAHQGLRKMYMGTLTLSLFLAVFGAVLLAILLTQQLVRPLLVLAQGVRRVAEGDLSTAVVLSTQDELGGLTRSFAQMTEQLAQARSTIERSLHDLTVARQDLQTILDKLTTGVVVLNEKGVVISANPSASRILGKPLEGLRGRILQSIPGMETFALGVQAQFHQFFNSPSKAHGSGYWQQAFALECGATHTLHLLARGAAMPDQLRLLVFDDISQVVSAQRTQAWAEVARRLAHEIKNPLTPIRLSAERLEMKLAGALNEVQQALLSKSVKTIVHQVDALQNLVNEFRDYGRLPPAQRQPLHLNPLVEEVVSLYQSESPGAHAEHQPQALHLDLRTDAACPPISGDAGQLRQLIHNLLQNAQDATEGQLERCIRVSTHWNAASACVQLCVADNGPGFAASVLHRAFEPYVTNKPKGTGLGLAVVKKIAEEHQARVELINSATATPPAVPAAAPEEGTLHGHGGGKGAQVWVSFPL